MPLIVTRRKDTTALTITGTVKLPDGTKQRVRARAQSDELDLAREEAATLEARMLRDAWHGERRGSRPFAEAALSYLNSAPRSSGDKARINRIIRALGDVPLSAVDQAAVNRVRAKTLDPGAASATINRGVITPIRAIMLHAHRLGWCDRPIFEIPKRTPGRTRYLLPAEADQLIAAAAVHVRPLLVFLLGTGARMSEAIELEWRDVDLAAGRAIFWRTKGGPRRNAALPPAVIIALAAIPASKDGGRIGRVFRWQTVAPKNPKKAKPRVADYGDRGRESGGHIRTAWAGAIRRAGLDPDLTPHDLRHTFASWHYALHRDLLGLKTEGGWSSVTLVERYAHLLPAGQVTAIRAFWGLPSPVTIRSRRGRGAA